MFIDIQFLKNEHKQIKKLKEKNYNGVFFITEEPKKHKIIEDFFIGYIKIGKSKRFLSLGIFDDIIEFRKNINSYDLFLLDFRKKEDKLDYRNSLFNTSLAYLPNINKGLLFPTIFFVNLDFEEKANVLARFRQNIRIIKKKKNKFLPIFCSLNFFEEKEKTEDFRNLMSFSKILGLHPKEAKKSLGMNIMFLYKQKILLKDQKERSLDYLVFLKKEENNESKNQKNNS